MTELNKIELLRAQKYREKFVNSLGYLPEEIGIFSAIVIDDSGEYSKEGRINASVSKKGEKYTLTLSDNFSTLLSREEKLFIIFHEIGHVMSGHIGDGEGRSLKKEIEADTYSVSKIGRELSAKIFASLMEKGVIGDSKEIEDRFKVLHSEIVEVTETPVVEETVDKGGNEMNKEEVTKTLVVEETVAEVVDKRGNKMAKEEYSIIAENLPIYSMEKGQKGTYLNLGSYREFDIVAIYNGKEVKLWRIPSENFYESSPRKYEQIIEHRGKEEVMISDNRQEGKFLSHNIDKIVGQGLYFGKTEKEFKLKERFTEYVIFDRQGHKDYQDIYSFLDRLVQFAKRENLSLKEAAVQWVDTDCHIAKISDEDSYTLNLETKMLTQRSVRNGKVTLRRGVHPKSKTVVDFLELLKRNQSLTSSLKENIKAFLLKEMDDSLKEEMSYVKDSYSLDEMIVLSRYPNYLWVLDSPYCFECFGFYYLKWTSAVRQSKLMKKGEFLKKFMPRLGKKTANRLASSSIILMPSYETEDWPYAFIGRLADPKLLIELAEKIAAYKWLVNKPCLYLDNQVHQGLSFLTLERWLNRKGLSERLVFLINKAIQSSIGGGQELRELEDSMHILVQLYESYPEVELSELAGYRSIKDFHDALVRTLRRQERQVNEVPYIYSQKTKDLTLKSGQWEIVLPGSEADIVDAGDLLNICVGSSAYTSRHNKDNFYILFLQQKGRLTAVIELKDKGVYQFKFKYNSLFHRVQLEHKRELGCFIKGWMEDNQLTDESYDLAGLDDTDWTNNRLQVTEEVRVMGRDRDAVAFANADDFFERTLIEGNLIPDELPF